MVIQRHVATGKSKCRQCQKLIPKGEFLLYIHKYPVELRLCKKHASELAGMIINLFGSGTEAKISTTSRFDKIEVE